MIFQAYFYKYCIFLFLMSNYAGWVLQSVYCGQVDIPWYDIRHNSFDNIDIQKDLGPLNIHILNIVIQSQNLIMLALLSLQSKYFISCCTLYSTVYSVECCCCFGCCRWWTTRCSRCGRRSSTCWPATTPPTSGQLSGALPTNWALPSPSSIR